MVPRQRQKQRRGQVRKVEDEEEGERGRHLQNIDFGSYSPFGLQSKDQELQRLLPTQVTTGPNE